MEQTEGDVENLETPQNLEAQSPKRSFPADFILLSEFSELEGPVPLQVIPEGGSGKFKSGDFVLRIMAVDHQNKNTDLISNIYI